MSKLSQITSLVLTLKFTILHLTKYIESIEILLLLLHLEILMLS